MRAPCIKVPLSEAEKTKKELAKMNALANLKWKKENGYAIIPLKREIENFEICYDDFEERKRREKLGSFDIIGDIAIVKFKENVNYEELAKKLVDGKSIKKLAVDMGVKGKERIRELKLIVGDSFETIHKEYGVRLKVDISKVYFSPRLATERWRVVQRVKDGEVIFDMFAGCGPFSILIAKYRKVKIYACDINPYAIEYLKENVRINKVEGIIPILGDAREAAKRVRADRIIMNLPHSSFEFLEDAINAAKNGAFIHYYEILPRENMREKDIVAKGEDMKAKIKILEKRKVHAYSPSKDMFAFLLQVFKST